MRKKLNRLYYRIFYGMKFDNNYYYKLIKDSNLRQIELIHFVLISEGWEQIGEVKAGLINAYCFYRKKK
jgi:hypothetical protein